MLFLGSTFISAIVILPQLYQVVYQDSPAKPGYRLLCVTLVSPLSSGIAGVLMQRRRMPPLYIFIAAQSFIILGVGLICSLHADGGVFPKKQYVYEIFLGVGFGAGWSCVVMSGPLAFTKKDIGMFLVFTFVLTSSIQYC